MRLLLDTTYLMRSIKVKVEEVKDEQLEKATRDSQVLVSEIQIFELYAKGVKYTQQNKISLDDLVEGVESTSHLLKTISMTSRAIMRDAYLIRQHTRDLIDAIILATAINNADALATLDDKIVEAYQEPEIKSKNPTLKILKI